MPTLRREAPAECRASSLQEKLLFWLNQLAIWFPMREPQRGTTTETLGIAEGLGSGVWDLFGPVLGSAEEPFVLESGSPNKAPFNSEP